MNRRMLVVLLLALLALIGGMSTTGAQAQASLAAMSSSGVSQFQTAPDPSTCLPAWRVVSSPNASNNNYLVAVAAITPNDVWAVGSYYVAPDYYTQRTLIEHWNGSAWAIVPSPNPSSWDYNSLVAIDARSRNDIWAVGYYEADVSNVLVAQTLVLHYDGTVWSVVPSPNNVELGSDVLRGVAARSPHDVWFVGYFDLLPPPPPPPPPPGPGQPTKPSRTPGWLPLDIAPYGGHGMDELPGRSPYPRRVSSDNPTGYFCCGPQVMHYDGNSISIVASPDNSPSGAALESIVALSPHDVWAVGTAGGFSFGGSHQTFTEHWNGSNWSIVPSPNGGVRDNRLMNVSATSRNDIWAVGYYCPGDLGCDAIPDTAHPLAMHYNGSAWSLVPTPDLGPNSGRLYGVAANSRNDVWAVGAYGTGLSQPLTEHWDGESWSTVSSPSPGTFSYLGAVSANSRNDVWAVGGSFTSISNDEDTLVERYSKDCR